MSISVARIQPTKRNSAPARPNSTAPIQSTGSTAAPSPTSTPTPTPGHGTTGTPTPVPTPSLDSVRIQNTTGLALVVTVHLISLFGPYFNVTFH